jgi:uncharacterized membrane protein
MYGNYGGAIVVIAIGAVLKYAVTGTLSGISIATVGLILMLAGIAWLVLAIVLDLSARRRTVPVAERERVVERDPALY